MFFITFVPFRNHRKVQRSLVFRGIIFFPFGTAGSAFMTKSPSAVTITKPTTQTSRSKLYMGPPVDPAAPITERSREGSRKYCRTVYTHESWVTHRSPDRFVNNLGTLFNSGIYKQVGKEVALTTSIAALVCGWNLLTGGYQDLAGTMHDPIFTENWAMMIGLPLTLFTILTPSLGLLLVFRTNASYNRWNETRKFCRSTHRVLRRHGENRHVRIWCRFGQECHCWIAEGE